MSQLYPCLNLLLTNFVHEIDINNIDKLLM